MKIINLLASVLTLSLLLNSRANAGPHEFTSDACGSIGLYQAMQGDHVILLSNGGKKLLSTNGAPLIDCEPVEKPAICASIPANLTALFTCKVDPDQLNMAEGKIIIRDFKMNGDGDPSASNPNQNLYLVLVNKDLGLVSGNERYLQDQLVCHIPSLSCSILRNQIVDSLSN